ncbi:hypothetical protein ACFLQ9_00205 [Bacteroidota bacterium]
MILIFVFLFSTCTKEENEAMTKEAILSWTGAYEVDGCGFYIKMDNKTYKPENEEIINEQFQTEGNIAVIIEFEFLNRDLEVWCGDLPEAQLTEGIRIISIKEKNF